MKIDDVLKINPLVSQVKTVVRKGHKMKVRPVTLVSVGASFGAMLQNGFGRLLAKFTKGDFPWAPWWINMLGTFLPAVFFGS